MLQTQNSIKKKQMPFHLVGFLKNNGIYTYKVSVFLPATLNKQHRRWFILDIH
ncbi:hypothetical protein BDC45DRAFT_525799 [Circinella umbellata]|nr:hypothetical protein BDC45DRAFT_525799 [Circinella umbellata]